MTHQVPYVRRVPQAPEISQRMPDGPNKGILEESPEVEEKGDPTTKKEEHKPKPNIDRPFKPDLEDKKKVEKPLNKKTERVSHNPDLPVRPSFH